MADAVALVDTRAAGWPVLWCDHAWAQRLCGLAAGPAAAPFWRAFEHGHGLQVRRVVRGVGACWQGVAIAWAVACAGRACAMLCGRVQWNQRRKVAQTALLTAARHINARTPRSGPRSR